MKLRLTEVPFFSEVLILNFAKSHAQKPCLFSFAGLFKNFRDTNEMAKSTKELAKELGLLRKRPLSVSSPRCLLKRQKNDQRFSHLIIIDFESTCWENDKLRPQEIIEFPAVVLNTQTGQLVDEFHFYLQPSEFPTLSSFCQQLTGISQNTVDEGIPLSMCLKKFVAWLGKLQDKKGIVCVNDKSNALSGQSEAALVTWSDWDLGVCLLYETRRKQISRPSVFNNWIDLRATYRKFYSRRPEGLNGALKELGIEFEGRQHSGLDDAKNTARLAWRMICDGCNMTITKSLKTDKQGFVERMSIPPATQKPDGTTPLKLHGGLPTVDGIRNTKSPFVIAEDKCETSSPSLPKTGSRSESVTIKPSSVGSPKSSKLLALDTLAKQGLVLKNGNQCAAILNRTSPSRKNISKQCHERLVSAKSAISNSKSSCGSKTIPSAISSKPSKPSSISLSSSESSITVTPKLAYSKALTANVYFEGHPQASSLQSHNKTMANTSLCSSMQDITSPSINSTKGLSLSVIQQSVYKTSRPFRSPCLASSSIQTPTQRSTGQFKTPIGEANFALTGMRATPPLCLCGRRSKRRQVQNNGPNMGRLFFTCPIGRQGTTANKVSCGFFQWESPVDHPSSSKSAPTLRQFSHPH
ncbi:hypothetical protein RRG08_016926 [Elysia crispata]|uniref:GRF-type domain-containing protein n=1 Tax=Elysia crispata TaxID=231223 RepID=A0AAE1DL13_9GAST|nr:hypothetical protein RRG08_016926 [Elysia crispata]